MSDYVLSQSVELLDDYAQIEDIAPEKRLQAVEGPGGAAILFSIADGLGSPLNATIERYGQRSSWSRHSLSGPESSVGLHAPCKTFVVARSHDGALRLAMVLRDSSGDKLYICDNATPSDAAWLDAPAWREAPYDDAAHPRAKVIVADVFLSDAKEGAHLVVDILRDAPEQAKIYRYYVAMGQGAKPAWKPHDLAANFEANRYASCLGRRAGQGRFAVEGLYTAGAVGGHSQLLYTPLYNVTDPTIPPSPDRLTLPGGAVADAIAVCRRDDETTDLYVAAGGALYVFPSDAQEVDAKATELMRHPILTDVEDLFAYYSASDEVTVWGRNAALAVFCLRRRDGVWSVPLSILAGAEQLTPFYNGRQSADSFFVHTGEQQIVKATKSPGSLLWNRQTVQLPPLDPKVPARKRSAYMTTVQAIGSDSGAPAGTKAMQVSARSLTPVFINHLYYVIGPDPIEIETDAAGRLTVVEAVQSLAGAHLTFSIGSGVANVDPIHGPLLKTTALDTPDKLKAVVVPSAQGAARHLLPGGTTTDVLQRIADANRSLQAAHAAVGGAPADGAPRAMPAASAAITLTASHPVDVGDLFAMIAHGVEAAIKHELHVILDAAKGVWTAVLRIADEVYHAALVSLEAIAAAATWLYKQAQVLVQDLIDYCKLLFNPAALRRTKDVLKCCAQFVFAQQVYALTAARKEVDAKADALKGEIDSWLKGPRDWTKLGPEAKQKVGASGTKGPHHGASGAFLAHHVQGNLDRGSSLGGPNQPAPAGLLDVLLGALTREADDIGVAVDKLLSALTEFPDVSAVDFFDSVLDAVADLAIDSAKNLLDAVIDILCQLAANALHLLDTPIHIPVVSDILSDLGVPEFSLLDLFCWVGAFAANAIYVAIYGKEPFPAPAPAPAPRAAPAALFDDAVGAAGVRIAPVPPFVGLGEALAAASARFFLAMKSDPLGPVHFIESTFEVYKAEFDGLVQPYASTIFIVGNCSASLVMMIGALLQALEAQRLPLSDALSRTAAASMVFSAALSLLAEYVGNHSGLVNSAAYWIDKVLTGVRVCFLIGFGVQDEPVGAKFGKLGKLEIKSMRGLGAVVDSVCAMMQTVVRLYQYYELAQKSASQKERSLGFIYNTSQIMTYCSRIGYGVAVNSEPPLQTGAIIGMVACAMISALLVGAESAVATLPG
ncbi:MAG: hypothetical protein U1E53_06365 [Dongiaceae bacterium]